LDRKREEEASKEWAIQKRGRRAKGGSPSENRQYLKGMGAVWRRKDGSLF